VNYRPLVLLVWTGFSLQWGWALEAAKGRVFHDANSNGKIDATEEGVPSVCVSNGKEVVRTDEIGEWELPVTDDTVLFVVKPTGWRVPVSEAQVPQFYYNHKPNGSPELQTPGVAPTGPLPESIDFALYPQEEPTKFSTLFFGDPQARGLMEVDFVTHDVVEECIGMDAAFGMSLGDIVADDPELFGVLNESIAQIGVPWYNVFGNHDTNRGATEDRWADETFERYYGPSTYAFEYGGVSFIPLNNIYFKPEGGYTAKLREEQIEFIRNYLSTAPEDQLVVLTMHAPIVRCENSGELFRILEKRPHTLSISAHYHQQVHFFLTERWGWQGEQPHHHFVNATVSGSWWCGMKDELGIPHATMNDGAPNGYSIIAFDGHDYSIRFKAARRPEDYQMNIYAPSEIASASAGGTEVLVNVFAGSERSTVEMKFGESGEWTAMAQTRAADPECLRMHELGEYLDLEHNGTKLDEVFGWKMDKPRENSHMWLGHLPPNPEVGTHTLTVRTTDMFGQTYTDHRVVRVR